MRRPAVAALTAALSLMLAAWLSASATFGPLDLHQTGAAVRRAAAVTFSEHIAPILYYNCVYVPSSQARRPRSRSFSYEDAIEAGVVARRRHEVALHAAMACRGRLRGLCGRTAIDGRPDRPYARLVKAGDATRQHPLAAKAARVHGRMAARQAGFVPEMPEAFDVPADGPDVYRNFVIPTGLTEDKWVRAVEFRPGTRRVVHHALFQFARGGKVAN